MIGSKSGQRKQKNRLPPFVPLLNTTLDSPAWKALSHGAKALYVALKRRVPHAHNRGYLSYRQAESEIRSSQRKISDWFKELQCYGFIVLEQHGCLGSEGKGKAPIWRLTEKGIAGVELPTNDFLRWNGIPFKRPGDRRTVGYQAYRAFQKQKPASYGGSTVLPTGEAGPLPTGEAPESESASDGVGIQREQGASDGVGILGYHLLRPSFPTISLNSQASLTGENQKWPPRQKRGLRHEGAPEIT